jgi:para-nitrobenzyl esterase
MGHNAWSWRTCVLFALGGCVAACEHAATETGPDTRTSLSPASTPDSSAGDDDAGVAAAAPRVTSPDGELEGRLSDQVRSFLGIPYAQPPLGALRFREPEPNDPWSGLRRATHFGARCAQLESTTLQSAASESEDCLYLNVWTPEHAQGLPVMVFIHGGDHNHGSASDPVRYTGAGVFYSGQSLAAKGVVVVTLDYRLGALGFLAHAALSDEGAKFGNQGLWDQQLALRWVRRNIRAFGGDAEKVTLFGEGSGASDVCWHIASPLSRNLFRAAIMESGGCTTHQTTRELAQRRVRALSSQLACDAAPDALACLRAKTPAELLAATPDDAAFGPMVDGDFMPRQPRELYDLGQVAKVVYLLGSNSDEGSLLTQGQPEITSDLELNQALTRTFSTSAAQIRQRYPTRSFSSAPNPYNAAFVRIVGDARVVCSTSDLALRAARLGAAVYLYNFGLEARDAGRSLGAVQGAELPYVFGSGAPEFTQGAQRTSDRLQAYWTSFAATGNPNGDADQLTWPAWSEADDLRIDFARTSTLARGFRADECALWRASYNTDFLAE